MNSSFQVLVIDSCYNLLMVALGWMNLFWMGLFASIIFGEKMWSSGVWIARSAGIVFLIMGIMAMVGFIAIHSNMIM